MTKKEQNALLRNALRRLHFIREVVQDQASFDKALNTILEFTEALGRADMVEDAKQQQQAIEKAYKLLETIQ